MSRFNAYIDTKDECENYLDSEFELDQTPTVELSNGNLIT